MKLVTHTLLPKGHKFNVRKLIFFANIALLFLIVYTSIPFAQGFLNVAESKKVNIATVYNPEMIQDAESHWFDLYNRVRGVKIGFVGDIMLDRGVEFSVKKYGKGDTGFPFENIRDEMQSYDLLFGNLEGPISDKGSNHGSIYSFRMNPKNAEELRDSNFSVLSIANNHAGDWGIEALTDTLDRLNRVGITSVGVGYDRKGAYRPKVLTLSDGTMVAFIAMSEFSQHIKAGDNNPGIAIIEKSELLDSIEEAEAIADITVVSFHYGYEYEPLPNKFQEDISKFAIDSGADIVIGHHPHVLQPVIQYKDGYIAYSLGNFIFDQSFSEETMEGGILEAIIMDKKITNVSLRRTVQNEMFQVNFKEESR
ncbi:MAG: hypothetical protein COV70_02375 [Parcubacteria group bacterium CG11_big_fil_rev_8_21_14_0_20_39_22]|nr:MAG: hypothetical protein COV70_02375 [Parcubacteria group bacterium CG11_big_fil_rev_8_21_14_0_20_39_22]